MAKSKKLNYTYAVGRRKQASARARLFKGKGVTTVNSKPINDYFPGNINNETWSKPFKVIDQVDNYYLSLKVVGGGLKSQVEAVSHAIAKAFDKENREKYHTLLKKAGLLTRDSRVRERRKVGKGGKARREKQSPKR